MTCRSHRPGERFAPAITLLVACFICLGSAEPSHAQNAYTIFSQQPRQQPTERLSRTVGTRTDAPAATTITREKTGTAFFVDDAGHMLTAGHAAVDCARMLVSKEGRVVSARVVAVSSQVDLALIQTTRTLGLSAVFPRTAKASANDMMFAAAYDTLPPMTVRGGTLANATVSPTGGEAGYLAIDSTVTFGASGAPVLDGRGLVQGVISRRTGVDHVLAVDATQAKAFLVANHVAIDEDDRPQIAGSASRANRAASISARVTCLQN
jgi:S1-C subfamily serine protease